MDFAFQSLIASTSHTDPSGRAADMTFYAETSAAFKRIFSEKLFSSVSGRTNGQFYRTLGGGMLRGVFGPPDFDFSWARPLAAPC